jgi:hypothetical protein
MPTINLSPITAEQAAIQRRQKMAEALQQQAQQPLEMPTTPGVQVSPLAGLAKVLQGYMGGRAEQQALAEQKKYESDYMSDLGFLLRNAGSTEPATAAVPEQTISTTEPNVANQNLMAVASRQAMRDPNAPVNPFERQIGVDERAQISQLPMESTQTTVTPAIPARPAVPFLSADLLSPDNAKDYIKTSAGKTALAQYLIQQQDQQQAAAQRAAEKAQEYRVVPAGGTVMQGNKTIFTAPKDSPVREVKTTDANGMPVTKYIPENVLLTMGAIPDQFKGFASDLIMAKNLPPAIMNDPQLLNLVGSQLNKAAGQVTQEDVGNYMLKVAETRAKLGYEGIPFAEPKPLVAAPNPLIKPTLPKGVPLNAIQTGKFTPDGRPVYQTPDGKNHVEDK